MKSFKTLLILTATLSGALLAGCGVDPTEAQGVQMEQGGLVSSETTYGPQCTGTIQCAGSTSTSAVTVSCKWASTANNSCIAKCPSNTTYKSGACGILIVDPGPGAQAPAER